MCSFHQYLSSTLKFSTVKTQNSGLIDNKQNPVVDLTRKLEDCLEAICLWVLFLDRCADEVPHKVVWMQ